MSYKYILFDLDGTITNPEEGICKCVVYSLQQVGMAAEAWQHYRYFIGPPLIDSYKELGMNDEQISEAVRLFRVRFSDVGWCENIPYDGIHELLDRLSQSATLAIATSKPTIFANKILDHFDLSKYFDVIVGSEFDGTRNLKADVIEEVLIQLGQPKTTEVVMVGDRKHDVEGANAHNLQVIRVLYGFGSADEHKGLKTLATANSLTELKALLT